MGDSTSNRDCRAMARRILDLANGEVLPGADAALERHLAACAPCRERLAHDRADRAAREAAWTATRFPPDARAAFWTGLERRVAAPVRMSVWRRPVVSAAASLALLAGGVALGVSAGPWVKRWWGSGPAPMAASAPTARVPETLSDKGASIAPAAEVTNADAWGKARYAWPELKLVSGRQGGGF